MTYATQPTYVGSSGSDDYTGTHDSDYVIGNAGDDMASGGAAGDLLYGDYVTANHLQGTEGATGFGDYAASGSWHVVDLGQGHQEMSQTITTQAGGVYEMTFEVAANYAAGVTTVGLEVLVDGVQIADLQSDSGVFGAHTISFTASDGDADITFRSVSAASESGPVVDTSGPIFTYDQSVVVGGQTLEVKAFAEGQANLYQVLNGTLHVFDTETSTYSLAGASGTVVVNAMGFNQEDNLLYAIAVGNGVDALGNAVQKNDLVMLDAEGNSYRIGETPYRSWTGDFDDNGNLWYFDSSMNHITVVDVDTVDEDGNPVCTVFDLPDSVVTKRFYDLSFDAATQSFSGLCRPSQEGGVSTLLTVDVSGSEPVFSTIPVVSTIIDGVSHSGVPHMTFGAAIYDADGNLFVGGNSGDHDMNDSTAKAGGIYRVIVAADGLSAGLELVSEAPGSYSNDGAGDPRALSPFAEVDLTSSVLLRNLQLTASDEGALSFDDTLMGEGGADTIEGGIGADLGVGGALGDSIMGGEGADSLYGGAGPDATGPAIHSVYDDDGTRYDQFGNILQENDDFLSGGAGDDLLSGSAGHDTLEGGEGDDDLSGGTGFDVMSGGEGDDTLSGGSERDSLYGGDGNDVLKGGTGDDLLSGGAGADQLTGSSGSDSLLGGSGDDDLSGGSGDDQLDGGSGDDSLSGGSGDDLLSGDTGDDTLLAGSGDDTLTGGGGQDSLRGGAGQDALYGGDDRDKLNGDRGDDLLDGGEGRDTLNGSSGDDTLFGGDGKDALYLGSGDDNATGGSGADRFVFRSEDLDGSADRITDFSVSEGDRLDFRSLEVSDSAQWLSENCSIAASGSLQIGLGGGTLELSGLSLSGGSDLTQIFDCFMF